MSGVQTLVDTLAERLESPVGVDDRRCRAIAYSSHPENVDPVRRISILGRQAPREVREWLDELGIAKASTHVRVPRNEKFQMVPRVCFPLRSHARLLGYLWLIDEDDRYSAETLDEVEAFAEEICQELFLVEHEETEVRRREAETVDLLTAGPGVIRQPLPAPVAPAARYAVSVVDARVSGRRPALEGDVRLIQAVNRARRAASPRQLLAHVSDGAAVVVTAAADDAQLTRSASCLLSFATTELADLEDTTVTVGVSASRRDLNDLHTARREAELAVRVAAAPTNVGPLALWSHLGAYRVAVSLVEDREPMDHLPGALLDLLHAPDADVLVPSVETFLERGGNVADACTELFIHRSSLYKRLRRAEEVAGIDLRSGSDRLEVQLGLRLWRLAGAPLT